MEVPLPTSAGSTRVGNALLVQSEHGACTLLRAELLERGFHAACALNLGIGILNAANNERSFDVILADQTAISNRDCRLLEWLTSAEQQLEVLLLGRAAVQLPAGPWHRVIRRPVSLETLANVITEILARVGPIRAWSSPKPTQFNGYIVRFGAPWPMIGCLGCGTSRHYEMPRDDADWERVHADIPAFGLEHVAHFASAR